MKEGGSPHAALNIGEFGSAALMLIASYFIINAMLPETWSLFEEEDGKQIETTYKAMGVFWATIAGLVAGLAVGKVTEEFAQYWAPIIEEEGAYETFIPHVLALSEWDDDEDIDRDAPAIFEDSNEIEGWYACDDIEHINNAYADGGFFVSNITDEDDDWAYDENEKEVEGYCLKGREGAYLSLIHISEPTRPY